MKKIIYNQKPSECDLLCEYRYCYNLDFDKGSFTQGVGYTSYYSNPKKVCMNRKLHGCEMIQGLNDDIDVRPIPDLDKLIRDLRGKKDELKCTNKVRREFETIIDVVRLLADYIR